MKTLYTYLQGYVQKGQYPFHMPGHKGRKGAFSEILPLDITEIDGFDNLHHPEGLLLAAQERCAAVFGAEESFFLVNGSTCGLEAAVLSVANPGDTVIVARNCHRSVYSGLTLSGAHPVYIQPSIEEESGLVGGILPQDVEALLKRYPHSKAVILTSPTFEGFTSDIEAIRRITESYQIPLVVDEAHGPHFAFHPLFPKTALSMGADLVVQSLHKTLPSLTQTAVLHVQGNRIDRQRLKQVLQMVQSSSPSYIFMASMDECIRFLMEEGKEAFSRYGDMLLAFRKSMKNLECFRLADESFRGKAGIFDIDLGKLCLLLPKGQSTGVQMLERMRKEFGLELEMAGLRHVLAMTSPADTEDGFLRLANAIVFLDRTFVPSNETDEERIPMPAVPPMALSPREGFFAPKETTPFDQAAGCICGEFIIPYPPGIPLFAPGEKIDDVSLRVIDCMRRQGISFVGCADGRLNNITTVKQ